MSVQKNDIYIRKWEGTSTINIPLEAVLALRLRCVWKFGVWYSCLCIAFWKVAFPELLRVIAVTLGSGQHLDFISIVIICDTQNMGVNTNLFFLQTKEKLFQTETLFPLVCLTLNNWHFSNSATPIIKKTSNPTEGVTFFVCSSFLSEMCAGNSKDVAGFAELVKTLCHQIVLSIIIACYVLGRKMLVL